MRLLLPALLALALAGPTAAQAATVTTEQATVFLGRSFRELPVVVVTAAPGERNDMTILLEERTIAVTDAGAPLVPGGACRAEGAGVVCDVGQKTYDVPSIRLETDDGDDVVRVRGSQLRFSGGALVDAGPGDDQVTGAETAIGGPGDDTLQGRTVRGGPGSDTLSGTTADFSDHFEPLTLTLDGQRNDGAPGERDLITADVHAVVGGAAGDVIVGGPGDDDLRGGEGLGDRISGGAGDDTVWGTGQGGHRLDGGPGDDRVVAFLRAGTGSHLAGGPGDDDLASNYGDDTLVGGPGADSFSAGAGRDRIATRDGVVERLDCGADADTITVDRGEWPSNCDTIDRPGAAAAAASIVLSGRNRTEWYAYVACPPDAPRACSVTLEVRDGTRTVRRHVRVSRNTRRYVSGRRRTPLQLRALRLTTRDANGRRVSATGPFGRPFGP